MHRIRIPIPPGKTIRERLCLCSIAYLTLRNHTKFSFINKTGVPGNPPSFHHRTFYHWKYACLWQREQTISAHHIIDFATIMAHIVGRSNSPHVLKRSESLPNTLPLTSWTNTSHCLSHTEASSVASQQTDYKAHNNPIDFSRFSSTALMRIVPLIISLLKTV